MRGDADMSTNVRLASAVRANLGEGPVWDEARGCLWFVDIKGDRLHRYDPATGETAAIPAPALPGWVFPEANGTLLVGAHGGVFRGDAEGTAFELLVPVETDLPQNRLNDAAVHPDGSVWFGTMDNTEAEPSGRFYRLADGGVAALPVPPVIVTNGPAFSPDGRTAYFVDTLGGAIHAADVLADGSCGAVRLFARLPEGMGYPDGPVVDSAGTVWLGLFGGWGVVRFAPNGTLLGRMEIPAANVTKIAFGGPDLKTVYVTTARIGLSESELERQPDAGSLFAFAAETAGLPAVSPRP